jgi:hypothetical protein
MLELLIQVVAVAVQVHKPLTNQAAMEVQAL